MSSPSVGADGKPQPVAGWVSLKRASDKELERETVQTLAAMLPFRAPSLNPRRVLVDTTAGLREGHGAQEFVSRDFDSRFVKTSTGNPLFTSGLFIKPPTLPTEPDEALRKERRDANKEDEYKNRGLEQTAGEAAADKHEGVSAADDPHLAMELAQFTWNKFELSRKSKGDKNIESEYMKNVDPSKIQQLLSHNIRSNAPDRLPPPECTEVRSRIEFCKKAPHPPDKKPAAVLPSSPELNYIPIPVDAVDPPLAPFSLLTEPLTDGNYKPLPLIDTARGNAGEPDTEAPLVLNPSPPETHLHVPGREQSYFSVPATPPSLSIAAPREAPQDTMQRATNKAVERRPRPLAMSTPPEPAFFVPQREIPAMPQTHEPKTAGFGSFIATPQQEKLEQQQVIRHKGADSGAAAPSMLLPRTPAEMTIDAPQGSKLAEVIGNDKHAKRDDLFSLPAAPPEALQPRDRPERLKEVELGGRPRPVLPRTPAETKISIPERDPSGAQLPPSGQFFSVPATPPDAQMTQLPAPSIVRSRRHKEAAEEEERSRIISKAREDTVQQLREQEEQQKRDWLDGKTKEYRELDDDAKELEVSVRVSEALTNRPRPRHDPTCDDAPRGVLPMTPPETFSTLPGYNDKTSKKQQINPSVAASYMDDDDDAQRQQQFTTFGGPSPSRTRALKPPTAKVDVDVMTVFANPATPIDAPVQPTELESHPVNPDMKDPKVLMPPTPLDSGFAVPPRSSSIALVAAAAAGTTTNMEDFSFSVPSTPPAAPLFASPPVPKKEPNPGAFAENRAPLPPTPVDQRLEALPPARGIDIDKNSVVAKAMERSGAGATAGQVFSMPATPPEKGIRHQEPMDPKSHKRMQAEEEEQKQNKAANVQMRSGIVTKPLMPPTPPETSVTLPPNIIASPGGGGPKLTAAAALSAISSRSGSTLSSSTKGGGGGLKPVAGQFFSMPATPPDATIPPPTISIKRRSQAQSSASGVMDTKPIIPSTPPEDFFALPRVGGGDDSSSSGGGPGPGAPPSPGAGGTPGAGGGGGGRSSGTVQEEKFFSITATPPAAHLPLKHSAPPSSSTRAGAAPPTSDSVYTGDRSAPHDGGPNKPARPHLPTPQDLSFGVPSIPASAPKEGYVEKPRPDYDSYYGVDAREPMAPSAERRLQEEVQRLDDETQKLREKEARGEKLTPDEAARKIQCLQRQRRAKRELERLKEQKADREKAAVDDAKRKNELEQQVADDQQRLTDIEAKAKAEGRELTEDEVALKIQCAQRQRTAEDELERMQQTERDQQRGDAERESALEAAEIEANLKRLEQEQRDIDARAKAEGRALTENEAARKIQCMQRQRLARRKLGDLKEQKAQRQRAEADAMEAQATAVDQEVEKLQAEVSAIDNHLARLEAVGRKRPLTAMERDTMAMLKSSRERTVRDIDRLKREAASAKAEADALDAAAAHTALSQAQTRKRDEIKAVDVRIAEIRALAAKQKNRPLNDAERAMVANLEAQQEVMRRDLAQLEEKAKTARTLAQAQIAEAESTKAQEEVRRLEEEMQRLAEEAERIREKEKRGEPLTPDEAALKIQCLQRQRTAKKDLEKRRAEAARRGQMKQRAERIAQLQKQMSTLKLQEQQFAEANAARALSAEERSARMEGLQEVEKLQAELKELQTLGVLIDPEVSVPALGLELLPSPQESPRPTPRGGRFQPPPSSAGAAAAAAASSSPDDTSAVANIKSPMPPTPTQTHHELPKGVKQLAEPGKATTVIAMDDSFSMPADDLDLPQVRSLGAGRHHGADMDDVMARAPLPPTPVQTHFTLPGKKRAGNEDDPPTPDADPLNRIFAEDGAATRIQSIARGRQGRNVANRNKEEREQREAEARRQAEAEQAKFEDGAATRIQSIQRQRQARAESARRRQLRTEKAEQDLEAETEEIQRLNAEITAADNRHAALEGESRAIRRAAAQQQRALTSGEQERLEKIGAEQKQLQEKLSGLRGEKADAERAAALAKMEMEAAKAAQAAAEEEEARRQAEAEQAKLEDGAATKIQSIQRQRQARAESARRRRLLAEKEAQNAQAQQEAAEQKLKDAEEEERRIKEKEARGEKLTEDEAAMKIQCVQRRRMAQKRVTAMRAEKEQKEADLAAAQAADAEARMRDAGAEARRIDEQAKAEGRALTAEEAERKDKCLQQQDAAEKELEQSNANLAKERAEAEAAKAADEAEEAERRAREADEQLAALDAKTKAGGSLTEDEAALKIQCMQRRRVARKNLNNRRALKEQKEAEAAAAAAAAAETQLKHIEEEEQRIKDKIARGESLTEDEAATKIQCIQRKRMARKELNRRKASLVTEQAEADAAKAAEAEEAEAEKLRDAEQQLAALDAKTKAGGKLTEDEAALKIQCMQRRRVARKSMNHRRAERQQKEADAVAAKAAQEEEEAAAKLQDIEEEEQRIKDKIARGESLTEDEAATKIQCIQRKRMARKELQRRKAKRVADVAEADAVKAQNDLDELQRQQRELEERARAEGRQLTEDEAALKIQCIQRQRMARKSLDSRRAAAQARQSDLEATKAAQERDDAEQKLKEIEAEEARLREKEARGEKLTPDEAARKIQCVQRKRMAKRELERRKQLAADKELEARAAAAHEQREREEVELERRLAAQRAETERLIRETAPIDLNDMKNLPLSPEKARVEAGRRAGEAIQAAQHEAELRYGRSNTGGATSNLLATASPQPPLRSLTAADGTPMNSRISLPGLGSNDQPGASVASSNLRTPAGNVALPPGLLPPPAPSPGTVASNAAAAGYPSPTPVIIRRGSGSSKGGTPTQKPLTQQVPPTTTAIYRDPTAAAGTGDPADRTAGAAAPSPSVVRSSVSIPSPSPVAPPGGSRVIQPANPTESVVASSQSEPAAAAAAAANKPTVASQIPEATTMSQFTAQLESYFSVFDQSQMSAIRTLVPAYRNRQQDLWKFLEQRYEKQQQPATHAAPTTSTVFATPQRQVGGPAAAAAAAASSGTPQPTTSSVARPATAGPGSPAPIIIRRNSGSNLRPGTAAPAAAVASGSVNSPVQGLDRSDSTRPASLVEELALTEVMGMMSPSSQQNNQTPKK